MGKIFSDMASDQWLNLLRMLFTGSSPDLVMICLSAEDMQVCVVLGNYTLTKPYARWGYRFSGYSLNR
jgi:hypothetical protein